MVYNEYLFTTTYLLGIKSKCREAVITDHEVKIISNPTISFRTLVPGELLRKDPDLMPLIENPSATCWIGPECHIMAYPIRNGAIYNFVLIHEGSVTVGKSNEPAPLSDIKERYRNWNPEVKKVIDLVPACYKWHTAYLEKLERWSSESGRIVLIGDACHAMVPYLAQGAAMAVEDAVAMTECLARASTVADIPRMMKLFELIRKNRCERISDGARNSGEIWHLPDGPEQRERDSRIKSGSKTKVQSSDGENPNTWSDRKFQPWMFGFNAYEDVK